MIERFKIIFSQKKNARVDNLPCKVKLIFFNMCVNKNRKFSNNNIL